MGIYLTNSNIDYEYNSFGYLSTIQSEPNPNTRFIFGRKGKLPRKGTDGGPEQKNVFKKVDLLAQKIGSSIIKLLK